MIEIAVCDDDADDLNHIVNILHEIFSALKIGYNLMTFSSVNKMLDINHKIDIGVLDIAMTELNGIKAGRKLKEKFPNIKLIYITSYEEYCMQAINDVHAYSFLCKPLDSYMMQSQIIEMMKGISSNFIEKEFFKVIDNKRKEYSSIKLKLDSILYFEYVKRRRKVEIVLSDETYECECVFKKLVDEMQQYNFAVNCRGYLVNLSHINKIKGFYLYLDNGKELPIAQKRIADFRVRMNKFLQQNL